MPDQLPEQDPVTSKSYAPHYAIAIVVLIATLLWAMWDEAYGQRPWKRFQRNFQERYTAFLKQARSQSAQDEKDLENNSEYRQLDDDYQNILKQNDPQMKDINARLAQKSAEIMAVQGVFTDKRAYANALTYDIETTPSQSAKDSKQKDLDKYKAQQFEVTYPDGRREKYNFQQLEEKYNELKNEKGDLSTRLGDLLKPVNEAKLKRDTWMKEHTVNLSPEALRGLQNKMASWDPQIVQINVADANVVDRCESCHMGTREPVILTTAAMTPKGRKSPDEYALALTSHPEPDLLKIHDPDKFGCSPCHQGNGRATTSVEKAHGNYEHWLWPMFRRANMEAGCQTCHAADMWLNVNGVGSTISEGKFLFRQRGCNGCHRYEGYDREPEELLNIGQQIKQMEQQQRDNLHQASIYMGQADKAESNDEANRLNNRAVALRVENSKIAGRIEQLDLRSSSLLRDMKKIGPDLKEIREKLNKNWIPAWLHKPTEFRPATKMPNFRLTDDQVKAISAYLWQTALTDPLPKAQPGNAARGKDLFETRGCLACHSIGEGSSQMGGDFAANLSRLGEKANYDYIFRWIKNPRTRTRPYCPYEKKDIGPEDYAKKGLPYVFDFEHSKCPNDGHELQVEQMTVMPNLRLSDDEVADIATYLLSQKQKDPSSYPPAPYMDDPTLKAAGKKWISHFGCAGCHEISGFEEEGRIGTELTQEGSKPIERLDFALLTQVAENGKEPIKDSDVQARLPEGPAKGEWYNHKGFFEHKLAMPNVYDQGMIKSETEKLRMPDPHLNKDQIRAITTFLLGSQETSLPASYQYRPEDARHDIQEGWWIVRKYNCVGCHQFTPGQRTSIETVPFFQDQKEKLPPQLLTEGARTDPEWLLRFLSNPSLASNPNDQHRNGVRPYLPVRMPTFFFSENELRKLVRFFQALSQQPMPYIPQRQEMLTADEMGMARALFTSQAAPCLKCHATGDPAHDRIATAPNFLLAKDRLKPGWTERWLMDPANISPGTAMPSGLFRKQGDHMVFSGPTPPSMQNYPKDQTKLLVRYIFQLTPEEQHRLTGMMPRSAPAKSSSGGPPVSRPVLAGQRGKAHPGASSSNPGTAKNKPASVTPPGTGAGR
ncbi:MAG: c-type cytochrome [Terriglobales bacterium]